jgi:Xaa-Pro dipeptidase
MFPKALFKDHLAVKLSQIETALENHQKRFLVIPSGIPKGVFWDDNYYPFKPNFHFVNLVPEGRIPHSHLIIEAGQKPRLFYYQPADYWHVVPEDPDQDWAENFEVQIVTETDTWQSYLPGDLSEAVWLGEVQDLAGYEWPEANINPADLVNELHYHRAIKTDYEIDRLAAANIMAAMGHLAARDAFLAEATEYEIHLAYMAGCKHTEQELPYGNIIALGAHGAILHYTELDKHLPAAEHRQTFLIDAGAVANHYCADITRTWSRDDDFLSLISDFDILQLDLIAEIKPGLSYVELHKLAHLRIAQFMYDHDLISCSAEEAVNNGISATFFPHGLGHLLGLQVHDIGGHQHDISGTIVAPPEQHPFLRLTRNLEVGYCVTIEPGLYFIDLLLEKLKSTAAAKHVNWSLVNTLKPFGGIRIEDDVVVTDYGHENLSRQAFQKLT